MIFYDDPDKFQISVVERKRTEENPAMAKISIIQKTLPEVIFGYLFLANQVEIFEEIHLLLHKANLKGICNDEITKITDDIFSWLNGAPDIMGVFSIDLTAPEYLQREIAQFTEVIYVEGDL